jgi:tRNA 2-thiouridine synthesizing protein A
MNASELVTVDARGMRCPWPTLRLARAMRQATAARLISGDPRAATEAAALALQLGWSISIEQDHPVTHVVVTRPA